MNTTTDLNFSSSVFYVESVRTSASKPKKSLFKAVKDNDIDTVFQLLEIGEDVRTRDVKGNSALHIAATYGYNRIMILLLGSNIAVDAQGYRLQTPLHCASKGGHVETANRLLQAGAQIDAEDAEGNTAVVISANNGHWDVVKYLLDKGASAKSTREKENITLRIAIEAGEVEIVRELLKKGAVSIDEDLKMSLLLTEDVGVLRAIEDAVPGTLRGKNGEWAIRQAAFNGQKLCLMSLLDVGVDVNATDEFGTALHRACITGKIECVKILLDRGAQIDCRNKDGYTPLHDASGHGQEICVQLLLREGAEKHFKNKDGNTPLAVAQNDIIRRALQ